MTVDQSGFAAALLDPEAAVPPGLVDPTRRQAGKRFDVYRNNVAVSLTEALETGFPVVRKLIGESNFKVLAGVFLRRHPPRSPLLMHYGADMPGFLADFPPLARLPYLADVARLELLLREAYHAADATPVSAEVLAALPPDALLTARLTLAPAARTLSSDWPVLGIWRRNSVPDAPKPEIRPEDVLIVRREFDPEPVLLPPGGAAFVDAIRSGRCLVEAVDTASVTAGFDLSATLAALVAGGVIISVETGP